MSSEKEMIKKLQIKIVELEQQLEEKEAANERIINYYTEQIRDLENENMEADCNAMAKNLLTKKCFKGYFSKG